MAIVGSTPHCSELTHGRVVLQNGSRICTVGQDYTHRTHNTRNIILHSEHSKHHLKLSQNTGNNTLHSVGTFETTYYTQLEHWKHFTLRRKTGETPYSQLEHWKKVTLRTLETTPYTQSRQWTKGLTFRTQERAPYAQNTRNNTLHSPDYWKERLKSLLTLGETQSKP
jgi:hypothetical protein